MLRANSSSVLRSNDLSAGDVGGPGAVRREAPPASGLPCLNSNNSDNASASPWNLLTGAHRKVAFCLKGEIMALVEQFGIERLGFLTLTFSDHVTAIKEASRRFNNLNRRVLKGRYKRIVAVPERQKSGRLHFHCLVVLDADIRTGLDFEAVARRDYHTASAALKSEWSFWLETAPRYGFGRTELLPIKSTAEGISKYVGKYIAKHIDARIEADKGARLVRYLGYRRGERSFHPHMMFNSEHAWLWRQKVNAFASYYGITDMEDFKKRCGPRWCYIFQDAILHTALPPGTVYPSLALAVEDSARQFARSSLLDGVRLGKRVWNVSV
ncbi:MAG TPA: hypothetical protein VGO67_04025 [Verrucomicrobiae bacterium]